MKEFLCYINTLKEIIDRHYEKEYVFYNKDDGTWYSREHCRHISYEELCEWVMEVVSSLWEEDGWVECEEHDMRLNHRINNGGEREYGYTCQTCGYSEWNQDYAKETL